MKIKELIKKLKRYNPDTEIIIGFTKDRTLIKITNKMRLVGFGWENKNKENTAEQVLITNHNH